ncbi:hypothetical protein IAU59_002415 [Kwoniella sp. CBS 9459]
MFGTSPPLHPSALNAFGGREYDTMAAAYQQPMPQAQPTAYGGIGFGLSGVGSMGTQQGMMAGGGGGTGEQAFPAMRGIGGMGGMGTMGGMPGMGMGMGMGSGMGMGMPGMGMGGMSGFGNGLVLLLLYPLCPRLLMTRTATPLHLAYFGLFCSVKILAIRFILSFAIMVWSLHSVPQKSETSCPHTTVDALVVCA